MSGRTKKIRIEQLPSELEIFLLLSL